MTDPQPQNSPSTPQGGTPWANPMDAPPPFPNAGPDYRTSNPYASSHSTHAYGVSQGHSGGHPSSYRANGDERLWAMIAHLSAPIATVVSAGWLNIVGPLVVYLVKKDSSPFVRNASAGAFNFMLTTWLMTIIGWILTFTVVFAIIGIPMIIVGALGSIVLGIVGAIKSWNGEAYTYPWQIKVLS